MSQLPLVRPEIPPGTLIDNRYTIQRLLGQGGLGRTYLAFDTRRFNEPCVLKEFAPSGTGEHGLEKSRNLFKREAKILHQIDHNQIPKFLACFEGDGRLFLVQEYVDGQAYSNLIWERQSRGQTFLEDEIIEWLKKLLPVLDYIHECGIVHRDISPDNIMLPRGKRVPVLIDFGVGKQMSVSGLTGMEQSDPDMVSFVGKVSLVGKVGYAPREQISLGICSSSSDLYALGVTAAVLLTGRDPSLLMDQYSLEWKWRDYAEVSDAFAKVLNKMLADTPKNRYQTAKEVLHDLEQFDQLEGSIEEFSNSTVVSLPPSLEPSPQTVKATIVSPPPVQIGISSPPTRPTVPVERSASINPALIQKCQEELARCIGPMASFVIEEILAQESPISITQLVDALEKEISDPQDAIAFRQRIFRTFSS
ncbi:MAG TPA: serine/threonine-protein kinase [Trichocoleus sp.]|jgi:serine/threonine-protein kinase